MKKITLALFGVFGFCSSIFSQPNISVPAPTPINGSTQVRLPNGVLGYQSIKGVMLLKASDLTALTATNVTSIGFILMDGTDPVQCTGNFSVYIQNTGDLTNNKISLGYTGALSGMQLVVNGALNVPTVAVQTTVNPTGQSAWTYGGAGLYVAWEYEETIPATNTNTWAATWAANLLTGGGLCATSASSVLNGASNTLASTDFRPIIVFNAVNTASNEVSVESIYSPGKVEKVSGSPVPVSAIIKNGSIGALANITVSMAVTGANSALSTSVIPALAAGGTTQVNFSYVPTALGNDNIGVAVPLDQVIANNLATLTQSVSCTEFAIHPSLVAGTYTSQAYGAGASASGLIYAIQYFAAVNCSATAVKMVIPGFSNAANLGKQLFAVVLDNTGAILGQGNIATITGAMLDVFSTVSFSTPVALASGQNYYLGVGLTANAYFPVGVAGFTSNPIPGYVSAPITGGAITPLNVGHLSLEGVLNFPSTEITASATKTYVCKASPQSVTLTATGAQSYTWSAAGLGNGGSVSYTPSASGNLAQVTVIGSYSTGAASGCRSNQVSLTFSLGACTGINENTGAQAVKLFPNPSVSGKSTISNLSGVSTITVFNTLGQVIITRTTSNDTESIDLSSYPAGNYMVKITDSNNESKVVKLVNQN